jgi:hypothetical protein
LAPTRLSYFGIAYNTKQVSAERVPKTYEDLLDPQWKGRMAWPYATTGRYLFLISLRLAWGEDKAMAYFKKLAEQKIINFASGSARTLVDRVIAGEYPIALNIYAHHPLISAAKGAPVNARLLDPVPSAAGTISVTQGAPHPHAAMLLVDLSRPARAKDLVRRGVFSSEPLAVPRRAATGRIVPKSVGFTENYIPPQQLNSYIDSSTIGSSRACSADCGRSSCREPHRCKCAEPERSNMIVESADFSPARCHSKTRTGDLRSAPHPSRAAGSFASAPTRAIPATAMPMPHPTWARPSSRCRWSSSASSRS